jgi:basic amino acid/polyamine antiporter, APA family
MNRPKLAEPQPSLSVLHGVAIMVGIVVGVGIFKTPPLVAANVESELAFIGVWLLGGVITLVGALCYGELAAAHPNTGGEYHFLGRAFGRRVAGLFGWARGTVIQTGAIAAVAFVFGDYAAQILPLGEHGPAIYAALAIAGLTGVNLFGSPAGKNFQLALTFMTLATIAIVIVAPFFIAAGEPLPVSVSSGSSQPAFGLAMILVLVTYGGWNEAAYISAEVRDVRKNMVRVLVIGSLALVVIYGLTNFAFLASFGLEGLRRTNAAGADLMRLLAGEAGAILLSLIVISAALSTLNGTIFTGARVYHAMGKDFQILAKLGTWNSRGENPANGILLQGVIALLLVALGATTRDGFQSMVDYTAPVFWTFLFLVGISLFVLRWREPERDLPFRVPLYPLTPILFCATCLYMIYASVVFTGIGALVGVAVLLAGTPLVWFAPRKQDEKQELLAAE